MAQLYTIYYHIHKYEYMCLAQLKEVYHIHTHTKKNLCMAQLEKFYHSN